ncbi:MAG: type I-C CRISPR-associated protein Cas8c/Csd1 [Tissierellia bacterium]|nr:type I-C CRISPR-associated protein Cas8c/Csd1 [Tissierellia bacterium]
MSYLYNLYKTYDHVMESGKATYEGKARLLPVGTITQNAQVKVTIDEDGDFVSADVIPKEDAVTIIPVTISSAARTAGPVPHPLFDNIWYMAGDFETYYESTKAKDDPYNKNFVPYMEQLEEWLTFGRNPYLEILFKYLSKKTLTKDLIDANILTLNEDGKLTEDKISSIVQSKIFFRFEILVGGRSHELWNDRELMKEYGDYYLSKLNEQGHGMCYIKGEEAYITSLHGKYIRNAGDSAKVISSNDSSIVTFKGRFKKADECAQISYEVSEKAHAALRWLIQKQAYNRDGLVILAWTDEAQNILQPTDNFFDSLVDPEEQLSAKKAETGEEFARRLRASIDGYRMKLDTKDRVRIISFDAATPGRLATLYYQEYSIDEYLERLKYWQETAAWHQSKKVEEKEWINFIGAPLPQDIVLYAFGVQRNFMELEDKMMKFHLKRLLPCILEKKRVPLDIVQSLIRTASRPMTKSDYNWNRNLAIACSMVRKFYIERKGVDYGMALNKDVTNRSYLFGRLLAVADRIEQVSNWDKGIDRPTTAKRLMEAFSKRPLRTWKQIYERILPYLNSLSGNRKVGFEKTMQEIMDKFEMEDFNSYKGLSGEYLLGYSHQMNAFFNKKEEVENDQ